MSKFTAEQIGDINNKSKTPEEVLKWGLDNLHPKLALALWRNLHTPKLDVKRQKSRRLRGDFCLEVPRGTVR